MCRSDHYCAVGGVARWRLWLATPRATARQCLFSRRIQPSWPASLSHDLACLCAPHCNGKGVCRVGIDSDDPAYHPYGAVYSCAHTIRRAWLRSANDPD
jgi:hypothetical protein